MPFQDHVRVASWHQVITKWEEIETAKGVVPSPQLCLQGKSKTLVPDFSLILCNLSKFCVLFGDSLKINVWTAGLGNKRERTWKGQVIFHGPGQSFSLACYPRTARRRRLLGRCLLEWGTLLRTVKGERGALGSDCFKKKKKSVFVTGWNQSRSFVESAVWPLAWRWGYGRSRWWVVEKFTS